ncbi:hypothetical protein ACVNP0_16070 [Staphylococcus aureus]
MTDGTVNANGTPHLIKDGGIYVKMRQVKIIQVLRCMHKHGIDKAFHGSGYQFDPTSLA